MGDGTEWFTSQMAITYTDVFGQVRVRQQMRLWNMECKEDFWFEEAQPSSSRHPLDHQKLVNKLNVVVMVEEYWTEFTSVEDANGTWINSTGIIKSYGHYINSLCLRFRKTSGPDLDDLYKTMSSHKVDLLLAVVQYTPNLETLKLVGGGLQLSPKDMETLRTSIVDMQLDGSLKKLKWLDISEGLSSYMELEVFLNQAILCRGADTLTTLSIAWIQVAHLQTQQCKLPNVKTLLIRGLASGDSSEGSRDTGKKISEMFTGVTRLELVKFKSGKSIDLIYILNVLNSRKQLEMVQLDESIAKVNLINKSGNGSDKIKGFLKLLSFNLEKYGDFYCQVPTDEIKRVVKLWCMRPCQIQLIIYDHENFIVTETQKETLATLVAQECSCGGSPAANVTVLKGLPTLNHIDDDDIISTAPYEQQ